MLASYYNLMCTTPNEQVLLIKEQAYKEGYTKGYEDAREKYDKELKKNDIQKWRVSGHP